MPTCPHCETEIEILNYERENIEIEWGIVEIENGRIAENEEPQDSQITTTGERRLICPECGNLITEEEILRQQTQNNVTIEEREGQIRIQPNHRRWNTKNIDKESIVECPKCHHVYEDDTPIEKICPRCETVWQEAKKPSKNKETRTANMMEYITIMRNYISQEGIERIIRDQL